MSRSFNHRAFLCLGTLAAAAPIFDVKLPRGLDFTLLNSPAPQKYLIETMPGGVALFDYIRHVTSPMLLPEELDRANPRYWNRLYRQNKNASFTDVTEAAGFSSPGAGNYGMGVPIGNYEDDGFADIFVTNYGKNILYHNKGDGTFTDVTAKAGVAGGGWSASAGFVDFDNDGHLDLFVTRYMGWDTRHSKACGGAWQTYCPPAEFPATTNFLCRNRGDGTFEDISMKSGIASEGRALGVSFADNDDGWLAVLTVLGGPPLILMNWGGTRHWLSIILRGTRNNRDGLGAGLRMNRQTRFATTAGSYLSASDKRLHFGLGDSNTAFTEISWPSGTRQTLEDVPTGQFLEIREPEHP